jgi:hypothetical protein
MGLLDGGLASTFNTVFSGLYLDATLYRKTEGDDGMGGGSGNGFDAGTAVKVQPDSTTQAMRDTPGYIATDKRFLMLAIAADPDTDCEILQNDQRFSVINWSSDPARSYFDLHVRRKS